MVKLDVPEVQHYTTGGGGLHDKHIISVLQSITVCYLDSCVHVSNVTLSNYCGQISAHIFSCERYFRPLKLKNNT